MLVIGCRVLNKTVEEDINEGRRNNRWRRRNNRWASNIRSGSINNQNNKGGIADEGELTNGAITGVIAGTVENE